MAKHTLKVELLLKINELHKEGQLSEAERLRKMFLESIQSDQRQGRFSAEVALDRKSKKTLKTLDLDLIHSGVCQDSCH